MFRIYFLGRHLFKHCFASLLKGVHSKRKEFAPLGSKFFPFRVDHFSERSSEQESKQKVAAVKSHVKKKNGRKSIKCIQLL